MLIMEEPIIDTYDELVHIMEAAFNRDESTNQYKLQIIDPVIKVLETAKGRKRYVELGTEFIDANAEMLAKPYPSTPVSYPRKYVDELFELFGFDKAEFKRIVRSFANELSGTSQFNSLMNSLTNVLHTISIFYADMIIDRKLRDSARQQIGLTTYGHIFRRYWPQGFLNEQVMEFTHSQLNRTWQLVKSESVVNWIYYQIEVAYGGYRSQLTVNMDFKVTVDFINRCWTTMNQAVGKIANRYYSNLEDKSIGSDVKGNETNLKSKDHAQVRDNLVRMISQGDNLYKTKSELYKGTARSKNVKMEELYNFAQKVGIKDVKWIIDMILYVFLVKEGHSINDINSAEYVKRINNFPTAIDRAIQGKPVIIPLKQKYGGKDLVIKAYICMLGTYILLRINDAKPD